MPNPLEVIVTFPSATDDCVGDGLSVSSEEPYVDPFDGFFGRNPDWSPPPGGLLDIPNARLWFASMESVSKRQLYSYQQPLKGRSNARVRINGRTMLMMSAYDYLGLLGHPLIEGAAEEALRLYGTGTGGVRLLTGTLELHRQLEDELAAFKGTQAALTFSSGYTATLGLIPALLGPSDRVIVDERAHRSILDACTLARVKCSRFRHNDPEHLRHRLERGAAAGQRTLIVVEGIYSMDGDVCPLPEIVELKNRTGAFLMVDEAHSFGSLGPTGRGVHEHFGLDAESVDIWMGSLSKAIPANGGFVAGSKELVMYLQHAAAPFMFSAALCPAATAAAHQALRVLAAEPERLVRLRHNAEALRRGLIELGYDTGTSSSCVVPVLLGDEEATYRIARQLYDLGIFVSAVVHPAVPRGAAILRLCATAAQSAPDLEEVLEAFRLVRA
ncbi:MAG TPA: pyridoxal phosphate-dependent aminotransferase family protein [Pyrinomonadaceae bacterium]|nr:pyridoxal phosphate-dependent aminotransferase family protein [Pyrinomonadaceae bacterium]